MTLRRQAPKVDVVVQYDTLRVLFDGVMHLHLVRSKLLGVQSWIMASEGKFIIEYTLDGGVVLCDYDAMDKWKAVIEGLTRVL